MGPNQDHIRRNITRKMNKLVFSLTTRELKVILEDEYMQSSEILRFMELTLQPRTAEMRERCRQWEHKIPLQNTQYPTLVKLVHYSHVYENWDGKEPFPGRCALPIKYYLDHR